MSLINKPAMWAGVVGGACLLFAGLTGYAAWKGIQEIIVTHVTDNAIVQEAFYYLLLIAGFGGLAVILGAVLIGRDKVGAGKFLISLGAGMGLIGFLIAIGLWAAGGFGNMAVGGGSVVGLVGLILSIAARQMAY
jgi:hypothetical protein